jgi:hypothetical protein
MLRKRLSFVRFLQAVGDYLRTRFVPELVPQTHSGSPVGHGTVRITLGDVDEFLLGLFVPERVEQGDSAGEGSLDLGGTRDWEMNRAELGFGEVFVVGMVFFILRKGS